MGDTELTVKGTAELDRAVKKINKDFDDEFKSAAATVARQVVSMARGYARTPQARLAASTLNAGTEGAAGTVTSHSGMFAGSEFGGGMRPETKQFPAYQGKRGYFLYPSMRANADRLNKIWDDALQNSMQAWDYAPR